MSVQHILDSRRVDPDTDTDTLEEVSAKLDSLLVGFQEAHWGPVGQEAQRQYQQLAEEVQALLNARRGVDGMTPL